ncbi:ferrous iron transport protein B [Anaerobiospirillum thomasii]|uniref:Ferrous iron transport protein B n=1 Tax=Anaerobiospirillum thomasii TaxID=179995 RepID=A0A2X0VN50_9GAMM|nr:ferrous iron transport protein B [Anaerobiospirillum thomasii]SPT70948.1 Ferrous iron transport protein B [Anaerobiospirillum thomasii]
MSYSKKIALFGNQNAGKTTLFNALTGSNQYVGNWPGVTVDRVNGVISGTDYKLEDLPGLYSLSPYSPEEIVSRDYLAKGDFDIILNLIDASHIEHSLSLTIELMTFKKPMIVALNMMDKAKAANINIDIKKLEQMLGVKVVPISASKKEGLDELRAALNSEAKVPEIKAYSDDVIARARALSCDLKLQGDENVNTFVAMGLLQFDRHYQELYLKDEQSQILASRARAEIENSYKMDTESLLAKMRYEFIDSLVQQCVSKQTQKAKSLSSRIDDLVTHKYLAIPIFIFVVYMVYYLAVSTVGTWGTDYANDVLFGEYATNAASAVLESANAPEWLSGLVIDGIVGGVGAVLGFVPQMVVLFTLLALLEQCGYMTRVAFVLDRIFRHFGLSGRCFIPMVIASGCAVPALMSSKTIENINERRLTVITTSFVPCSAKLPILAMIAAAFFPDSTFVAPGVYLFAIVSIIVTAVILKKGDAFNEEVSPFVMELPDYTMPVAKNIIRSVYQRCRAFVIKAGTVIFATIVVIWFLSSFNFTADGFGMVEVNNSMLAAIGSAIAFVFIPLGFASWQCAVSIFTGLLAKENVVGTLAVLLGLGEVAEDDATLGAALHGEFATNAAALSFLAFNLFSTPCIAAIGAMRRELANNRIFMFTIVYMLLWAYGLSFMIYHLGGLLMGELDITISTVIALAILVSIIYMMLRPRKKGAVSMRIQAKMI